MMKIITFVFFLLCITMISCDSDDVTIQRDITDLSFSKIYEFEPNLIEGFSMGMVGSEADNSLFISSRDDYPLDLGNNREQIVKLSLNNFTLTEKIYNKDYHD